MGKNVSGRRSRPLAPGTPTSIPSRPLSSHNLTRRLNGARKEDWDFTAGRIFGSMCTEPLRAATEAGARFTTANLGNPGLCPGTSRLEEEVMAMLLDLYHAPRFGAGGSLVTGGTEANLTSLWIARNVSGGREVVLPRSAHFSMVKALDLLSLRPRWVPVDSEGRTRPEAVRRAVTQRTAAIVGVAGSTELGAVDPLDKLSDIALEEGVHLHVDAAFGGFVLPFLAEAGRGDIPYDFQLEGVTSMTSDPHKMGMAPIPSGSLLLRRAEELEAITVASPYLSSPMAASLLGTRPSSNVASTFAALMSMGRTGYVRNVRTALDRTETLLAGGREIGLVPVCEPTLNVVAFRWPNPLAVQSAMLMRGWDLSAVRDPPAIRFLLMPHVTEESLEAMLKDLTEVIRGLPKAQSPVP